MNAAYPGMPMILWGENKEPRSKLNKHLHVETEEKMKSAKEEVQVWNLHAV